MVVSNTNLSNSSVSTINFKQRSQLSNLLQIVSMKVSISVLLILLLRVTQSIAYGDITMLPTSNTFSDNNIVIQFHVDPPTITFCVTLKYYGYFGILYANQMSHGDYTIAEANADGVITLTDSHSGNGYGAPVADTLQNVNLLGYQSDRSTYLTVKFSRLLDTGDSEDITLIANSPFEYSYAYSDTSPTLAYHGLKKKIFSGTLSNVASLEQHAAFSDKIIHGTIITIAWCLIADIAVYFKFAFWHPARLLIHTLLMTAAIAITLASVIFINVKEKPVFSKEDETEQSHYVVGLSVTVWMLLQMLEGVAGRIMIAKPEVLPIVVINLRRFHRWSGYILVIFCKANCILGWYMINLTVGFIVVTSEIALIIGLYAGFRWHTRGIMTSEVTKDIEVVHTAQTQVLKQLMKYPYNHKQVQSFKFVILDEKIYMLPMMYFHPGGMSIIEYVNGRQVDRFLMGICFLELYPHLTPNEHPAKSLQLLSTPIAELQKNPMLELTDKTFLIGEMRPLTQDISVFYFQPVAGIVIFRKIENLWHLGQYFSIFAFGKTRLYSMVVSFRQTNLYLRETIVKFLVPDNKRLKSPCRFMSYINQKYSDDSLMDIGSEARLKYAQGTLPLVIKRYDYKKAFTRQLYSNLTEHMVITGPKGRGMCLGTVPDGDIVIIAVGSGICRFLDLIDLLFKATVKMPSHIKIPENQLRLAQNMIKKHSFTLLMSSPTVQQLLVPDQLNLIAFSGSPKVRVFAYVKEPFSSQAFMTSKLFTNQSLNPNTLEKNVLTLKQLQMVYISAKPIICEELVGRLNKGGIDTDRIFFM